MRGPKPLPIDVTDAQRLALEAIAHKQTEPHGLVVRASIILMAHQGHSTRHIASYLHVSEDSVCGWKQRWRDCAAADLPASSVRDWLSDAPRSGAPPTITAEQWCQIMALACSDPKQSGRPISHWSLRELLDEILKRHIVESLSERHLARFFKRSRSQATPQPLLAHPSRRSGA